MKKNNLQTANEEFPILFKFVSLN